MHAGLRERALSYTLQELIQPSRAEPRDLCGLRVTVRCLSADPDLLVGGDWYLAVPLPCGDVVLAVGDVTGHGLSATGAMLSLRYAMAAFIAEEVAPAIVLGRLNHMMVGSGLTATAVVARYRPADGTLLWAAAGHPPILLADGDRVRALPSPAGSLLGLRPTERFAHARVWVPVGGRVVCYTDGMVGRGSIDDGIRSLSEQIRHAIDTRTPLLDGLDYATAGDDACVMVAHRLR